MKKLLTSLLLTIGLITPVFAQTALYQGGTGWATSTLGDLLVGTTSNLRYTRLPIGSTGDILSVSSGRPVWVATSTLGFPCLSCDNIWTGQNTFTATTTIDKVKASSVVGTLFYSSNNTLIASYGAGGGSIVAFAGAVGVSGQTTLASASSTNLTSHQLIASTTLWVQREFRDSTNATGTSGQYLQSTGTSTIWSTISGFVTNAYASSTFPSFGYASSTFVPFSYGTSTYVAVVGNQTVGGNKSFTGQTTFSTTTPTYGFTVATTSQFSEQTRIPKLYSNVVGYASNASTTFDLDTLGNGGIASTTIFATTTIVNPTGTLYNGNMYEFWLKATTTQGLYWGTNFASSTDFSLPSQIASGTTRILIEYRQDSGKLELIGLIKTFLN